jgi:hypothetical protein
MKMDLQRKSEKTMPGFTAGASIGKMKNGNSPTVGYMREDGKVLPQHIVCPFIYCFIVHGQRVCTCI